MVEFENTRSRRDGQTAEGGGEAVPVDRFELIIGPTCIWIEGTALIHGGGDRC